MQIAITKVKNEDAYIIAKALLGKGLTCTCDWAVLIPSRKRSRMF
jgi:hypothetical protein